MERKVEGGTVVGFVAEDKPAKPEAPKTEPKPKKGKKKE